jgi:hypothetical protein
MNIRTMYVTDNVLTPASASAGVHTE